MNEKWTKDQVIAHFQGREKEYVAMAKRVASEPLNFKFPYDGVENIIVAFWWLFDFLGRPAAMVELGCGAGTWFKLVNRGLGLSYDGYDSSFEAIKAAKNIFPWAENCFHAADIVERINLFTDLVFIHGVLMHLCPNDAAKVAAWTLKAGKAVMICEKTRWAKREEPAPHVWIHNYEAMFGPPSYQARMNETKDIFIWKGK